MTTFVQASAVAIPTGPGNTLYFRTKEAEWNYENRLMWAARILDKAAAGEKFDVPIGHEAFIEKVQAEWEFWSVELVGDVYVH